MNTPVICLVVALSISLAYTAVFVLCRRAGRPKGQHTPDSYEGPDSLQLMRDIDDHLDATALFDTDLADVFGPGSVKPAAELLEEK